MKKLCLLLCVTGFFISGCKKDVNTLYGSGRLTSDQELIQDAKSEFPLVILNAPLDTTSTRSKIPKTPLWNQATIKMFSFGKAVVIPLKFDRKALFHSGFNPHVATDLDSMSQLLIYRDSTGQFQAEVVTEFPDSASVPGGAFSGFIKVENWQGTLLKEFKYDKAGIKRLLLFPQAGKIAATIVYQICYSLDIYVYAVDAPGDGTYSSEDLGCSTMFSSDTEGSIGGSRGAADYPTANPGGSGGGSAASVVVVNNGSHPIANIISFIKCFAAQSGASFSVTLCVDQPNAGERKSYSSISDDGSSSFSVGHAFLEFTQNVAGVPTRAAIGFYPAGPVTPFNPSAGGSLNDDSRHAYDVSLTMSMTPAQFMTVLNTFTTGNTATYNLNTNNCATWALSALAAAGFNIKTTQGKWPFGGGDDPGDLGEDIRGMTLTTGMGRNMVGGSAPPNIIPCNIPLK